MEKTRRLRTWGGFLLLLLLLLIFLIWNILAGSVRLPASEIWTILQGGGELSQRRILLQIRLPRLLAALILRMTVYKESLFMNYLTSLLLGLACAALFYTRRFRNSKKDGKLYTVITVLLAIMAVIYGGMGLLGLLTYFGIV